MILNLTQHEATDDQKADGVVEPKNKQLIRELLTFDELPLACEVGERAKELAQIAAEHGHGRAMVGGAPFLMVSLEIELNKRHIKPIYAFSKRESIEEKNEDGTVTKRTVFKHAGFVE